MVIIMKIKSVIPAILCILVGFFMSNFMFNQYDKNIETVFNEKNKVFDYYYMFKRAREN